MRRSDEVLGTAPTSLRRVGLIGHGAIGRVLADEIERDGNGLELSGVLASRAPRSRACGSVDDLIQESDIIVEAAGQGAVLEHAERVIHSGTDLLVLSVGALADSDLLDLLLVAGSGRLLISTGALGGVDILRAASLSGGLSGVKLITTKPADALLEDWMPPEVHAALSVGEPATVFQGSARDVVERFPESTNVAATVGLATVGLDSVEVRLIADPNVELVSHRLSAWGSIGTYAIEITNQPSTNPRTSAVTPYAALRGLLDDQGTYVIR